MSLVHNLVARLRADTGQFDKNMKKSRTHMTRFGKDMQKVSRQLLAFGGGYLLVNRTMKWAVRSYMEQEKAERSLMAATGENIAQFKKYAAELQRATIYGDEQILSQMAYAKNLGVSTDRLNEAAKAAVGLAAKYRLELATSMMLVGRASQGQTQMLTRYGIALKESLSSQDKFNALLKIGAANFHLAAAEAETLEGKWTKFWNAAGDMGEEIVGHWLDVAKGMKEVISHYKGVEKAAEDAGKKIKENMPSFQTNMFGAFYYPVTTPKKVGPQMSDKVFEEANRRARQNMITAGIGKYKAQQEKELALASNISQKYIDSVKTEIQLTGYVGEARQHAAKMIKLETDLKAAGLAKTIAFAEKTKEMRIEIEKLGKVQKLARIAEDIGDSFADAFEDMIFDAKKFGDVMKSLMRDISRSVMRNIFLEPLAQGITKAFLPATVSHSGGMAGFGPKRNVPAIDFAGAPKLHNGLMANEFPTILEKGEQVIPKGGGGGGGAINVTINNKGQQLKMDGPVQFDGRELIINVVADNIQQGGQLRTMIEGV